ncbi:MAG: M81 family metallopeptidase, partial [Planctomycetota bacterium]|nr:M81 family metallopeptidase [Planctomycetota bacterium]
MARILLAEMKQETSTFNPFPTGHSMFQQFGGQELLEKYQGTKTEISGFMDVVAKRDEMSLVPTMSAASVSGGAIPTEDLNRLIDELTESVAQAAAGNPVDAVYMCLHGAMAGETEDDPEGRLLERVREVVGEV